MSSVKTLESFARSILFGNRLEDKFVQFENHSNASSLLPIEIPSFPGRPPHLSKRGKATFPSLHKLHLQEERGKVLHFFANHELLAMELMALVLLRFPDAPESFRLGIAGIIQEEQNHLRLYLSRMKELGIEFGDLPVNDYFWNSMKGIKSPLDFTVQMSLTFEQANLDFSLYFMKAIQQTGDQITAEILDRVFREEIGHVKHGLIWFNRWRDNPSQESDWEAYLKLLPLPLTPQRAKGFEFCEDARRKAGLSDEFIRELKIYSGSKGRPPVIWYYNPHCDSEIARGRPGFSPTEGAKRISQDLEHIPIFLCREDDVVLLENRPQTQWIESLQKNGFKTPEFAETHPTQKQSKKSSPPENLAQLVRAAHIGGIEPWGWSPDAFSAFQPLLSRLVDASGGNSPFCKSILSKKTYEETGLGKLFSKSWSASFLHEWLESHSETSQFFGELSQVGQTLVHWDTVKSRIQTILDQGSSVMLKAPYGTSGMQVKSLKTLHELEGPLGGWIKNTLSHQGALVVENQLNKLIDFSIQLEILEDRINLLEVRRFLTGKNHEYLGTYLGRKIPGLNSEQLRFFHSALPAWHGFLRDLGSRLRQEGYQGPAGVDAFLWTDLTGKIRLKPLVELNPRWTMGKVALELENHLAPGTPGLWKFIPLREISKKGYDSSLVFAEEMEKKYPLKLKKSGGDLRIESGVLFTNDPAQAKSVLTVLTTLPNEDLLPIELHL